MKVLICDFDLFENVGGGQTFYQSLIRRNQEIDFYYFRLKENSNQSRPPNANLITCEDRYSLRSEHRHCLNKSIFASVSNLAYSVRNQNFDIVDTPDYRQFAYYLQPALQHHGVGFRKIVLSMHGIVSTSIQLNWQSVVKDQIELLHRLENDQFDAVDLRYSISHSYIDEWKARFPIHYFDPFHFFRVPKSREFAPKSDHPSLNFLGRREKRKGPDLFLNMVWWLDPKSVSRVSLYGEPSEKSDEILSSVILNRRLNAELHPAITHAEMAELYKDRSVTVLPSIYDTFNLVALESLLSGCPTLIGAGAGVCRFLDERFPEIPYSKINETDLSLAVLKLKDLFSHYDENRSKLAAALEKAELSPQGPSLADIYSAKSAFDPEKRRSLNRQYQNDLLDFLHPPSRSARVNRALGKLQNARNIVVPIAKKAIQASFFNGDEHAARQAVVSRNLKWRIQTTCKVLNWSADNLPFVAEKLREMGVEHSIDRARIFHELARAEFEMGRDLVSAVYHLRIMRWLGEDRFSQLAFVQKTLKKHGFLEEADVAARMFGDSQIQDKSCYEYLRVQYQKNLSAPRFEYDMIDDRREKDSYRTSIIVSMYNAADKLELFLRDLMEQTLVRSGDCEIILVDSGSPSQEYEVFKSFFKNRKYAVLFARSAKRETIQTAWNRGIMLSRGEYLSFLGVDEMLRPDALELLASELDRDSKLDWVIGDSLVADVDKSGVWVKDVMLYDRTDYRQDLHYLECCYLSYVGALYRKSIHDRFGYYDGSFRAAGDTEFKNRILPHIRSNALKSTLGIFRNFPEERTTANPRAEIEDLRAWYLHRTVGGVRYAFENRPHKDVEDLIATALAYRKSYCKHISSDIDYAANLIEYLTNSSDKDFGRAKKLLFSARDQIRKLEFLSSHDPIRAASKVHLTFNRLKKMEQKITDIVGGNNRAKLRIFNDNRYEQHHYCW